ncbi:MAG: SIS domain-containing protein [Firmicutes bacterium]|nr:SIS domain-containing protein [Bacillota bacterium]
MSAFLTYFDLACSTLKEIRDTQAENIKAGSDLITKTILDGGMVHVFGAGHSHTLAEEMFARAGGLVPVSPILDADLTALGGFMKSSDLERLEGFGRIVFTHHDARPGEVVLVISQSGKNPAPVDVALAARERGLKVIGITSLVHSRAVPPGHSSGKKLYEIADVVIDNRVPYGDAAIEICEGAPRVAPLSTVACAAICNSLVAETASRLALHGIHPPVWTSGNVPGGHEANAAYIERYRSRWHVI